MVTRSIIIRRLALGLLVAAPVAAAARGEAGGDIVDGVAAIVNGRTVLFSDVQKGLAPAYASLSKLYRGDELEKKLAEQEQVVLRALMDKELILTCCDRPEDEKLQLLVEEHENRAVDGKFNGDRSAFLAALTEERISIEQWRRNVGDMIAHSLIRRREMDTRIVVSPLAIRQHYDRHIDDYREPGQVRLSVISITKAQNEQEVKLQAEQILNLRKQIDGGAAFEELAAKFSQDPKAGNGGDWGWVSPGELKSDLATVANTLEVGRVSDVIDTGSALCLLKVAGRREERTVPFQDVRDEIRKKLFNEQQDRVYGEWIDRMKKRSYVRVIDLGSE